MGKPLTPPCIIKPEKGYFGRGRFPGLHLNDEGNDILFSNFVNFIDT